MRGDEGQILATVRMHWAGSSFTAATGEGVPLCVVDRGGLLASVWSASSPRHGPLLKLRRNGDGFLVSFTDGREATISRPNAGGSWTVISGPCHSMIAHGSWVGSSWRGGGRRLHVHVEDHVWSLTETVAAVWGYVCDSKSHAALSRVRRAVALRPH